MCSENIKILIAYPYNFIQFQPNTFPEVVQLSVKIKYKCLNEKGMIAIVPHIAPRLIILAQRFVRRDGRDLEWELERKMRYAEPG